MKTHKDLNVYNLSIDLVAEIYKLTSKYPKEELYGLVSHIRHQLSTNHQSLITIS